MEGGSRERKEVWGLGGGVQEEGRQGEDVLQRDANGGNGERQPR